MSESKVEWVVFGPNGDRIGACDSVRVIDTGALLMSSEELGLFCAFAAGFWSSASREEK